jgi:beta-hydroxyacyl-ACP dehydratase FabZ
MPAQRLSIQEILAVLPHRYPFVLIDRVVEMVPGEYIKAYKNVTFNEPFFQGHFPDNPVMPGVLIVEAMAQAGGVLTDASMPTKPAEKVMYYFMGMDGVRFRRPVTPGDQIMFEVKLLKLRTRAVKMAGTASVDNHLVAEAELMASIGG